MLMFLYRQEIKFPISQHFFSNDEWPDRTIDRAIKFLESHDFFTKVSDPKKLPPISPKKSEK